MVKHATQVQLSRRLLTRILELPNLAREVQSLEPKTLHQLIRTCGLEDSGEIIALATTEQLMRIFDDDLWRSDTAGAEEHFDADRFGLWLEVLAEMGAEVAARKIADMDLDFVTAAVSRHILVLNPEAMLPGRAAARTGVDDYDPMEEIPASLIEKAVESSLSHEFSGYTVVSNRSESWDAMLSVLISLEEDHHGIFRRLMDRCHYISTEYIEDNGGLYEVLTAGEQIMEDLASDREQRREHEGYVTPAQAVVFLTLARQLDIEAFGRPPARDHVTVSYFRGIDDLAEDNGGRGNSARRMGRGREYQAKTTGRRDTGLIKALREAEIIPKSRLSLLSEGKAAGDDRRTLIRTQLSFVREQDECVYLQRMKELGYLANVLMTGCSFQARRFRAVEAADAVFAACNLALENWPLHWRSDKSRIPGSPALPPGFLLRHDLVTAFKVGWSRLHEEVSLHVGQHLVKALAGLTCDDRAVQDDLQELGRHLDRQVKAGTPWRERDNLDVLAILDQPSWGILLGLLDECPVVPKVTERGADASLQGRITTEFEFVAENSQILWAQDFVKDLPRRLLE